MSVYLFTMLLLQSVIKKLKTHLKSHTTFTGWLVLIFTLISLIGIINHEMWLDELHAWSIAVNNSSIRDLFQALRYEGHPALWHVCLYIISRFTRNPIAMQAFHLIISVGVVYLFTRFSTFSKTQKILFVFGYFPFFEYNLISRSYSLGALFIFLFCSLFPSRDRNYLLLSILLALLANTSAFGWIISICLAMTLVAERAFKRIIGKYTAKLGMFKKLNLIVSLSIFITGAMVALAQMIPPVDAQFHGNKDQQVLQQSSNALFGSVKHLASTLLTVWKSYIPIPKLFDYEFWNTNILTGEAIPLSAIALLLSLVILFLSIILFIRKPLILFLYLSGTFGILLFSHEVFLGKMRHYGHLFILFIVCVWLSSYYTQSNLLVNIKEPFEKIKSFADYVNSRKTQYLTAILFIHAFAGIFAFSMDLNHPFSASKNVSNFIINQRLNDMIIVGNEAVGTSPIAALVDKKIYYPEIGRLSSFVPWHERQYVDSKEVLNQVSQLSTRNNADVLLVLNYKLNVKRFDLHITKLSEFNQSIVPSERYYLYLVQKNRGKQ